MAKVLKAVDSDVVALFKKEEYDMLLSLLYEFKDKPRAEEIVRVAGLELSPTQVSRLSVMWDNLANGAVS